MNSEFAIIDNHYLQGPPQVLRGVNRSLAIDLVDVGLTVRNDKLQAYMDSPFQLHNAAHCRYSIPPGGYFKTDENGDVDYSRPVMVSGNLLLVLGLVTCH